MNRIYIQSNRLPKQEPAKEKDPVHFRSLMLIFFSCALIVIGILTYMWRSIEILSMGYEMRHVYAQQKLLQEQRQRLILEKAALSSLKRVENLAFSELQLVKPRADQILVMPSRQEAIPEKHD